MDVPAMLLMGVLQKCPIGPRRHNIWPSRPPVDLHLGILPTEKRVLQQALIRPGCGIHVVKARADVVQAVRVVPE